MADGQTPAQDQHDIDGVAFNKVAKVAQAGKAWVETQPLLDRRVPTVQRQEEKSKNSPAEPSKRDDKYFSDLAQSPPAKAQSLEGDQGDSDQELFER